MDTDLILLFLYVWGGVTTAMLLWFTVPGVPNAELLAGGLLWPVFVPALLLVSWLQR